MDPHESEKWLRMRVKNVGTLMCEKCRYPHESEKCRSLHESEKWLRMRVKNIGTLMRVKNVGIRMRMKSGYLRMRMKSESA